MSLRVLTPGTYSLLVDAGRPTTRRLGVPLGGPADRMALAIGNSLLGNAPTTPALEITLSGPTLRAESDTALCIAGPLFRLQYEGGEPRAYETFTLRAGQTLHIGGTREGCRAYVCVAGGFMGPRVLGSVTAFAPLAADAVLECATSACAGKWYVPELHEVAWSFGTALTLRCLPGPQRDWFDEAFTSQPYRVQPASNRMGVRLDGPALMFTKRELVSEAVAPGAVQITNDGRPIVLGVDGQTIGGYPKIAHVIDADMDKLGQLRPGDTVQFVWMTEEQAETASAASRHQRHQLTRRLRWASV